MTNTLEKKQIPLIHTTFPRKATETRHPLLGVRLFTALFAFAAGIQKGGRGASAAALCPTHDVGEAQVHHVLRKSGAKENTNPCLLWMLLAIGPKFILLIFLLWQLFIHSFPCFFQEKFTEGLRLCLIVSRI